MLMSHGMGHYLTSFLLTTGGMIAVLLLVYWYIRRSPSLNGSLRNLGGMSGAGLPGVGPHAQLRVESSLALEPRKRVLVVAYRHQRFLLSSTAEKTEFLSVLDPVDPAVEAEEARLAEQQRAALMPSMAGGDSWDQLNWSDRLVVSTRMVLSRYFPQMGGK